MPGPLETLSPLAILDRGYGILETMPGGQIIRRCRTGLRRSGVEAPWHVVDRVSGEEVRVRSISLKSGVIRYNGRQSA